MTDASKLRREYEGEPFDEGTAPADPVELFGAWFEAALASGIEDANAMVLATADAAGRPSGRVVLLKGYDPDGFSFYTNYASPKAGELTANPRAEMVFYWAPLNRQVRIAGAVTRLPAAESDAYFASRPRGARIGALASKQSAVIGSRAELEERYRRVEAEYEGRDVPRPAGWGGYRLRPETIEFWQGRSNRLHDRLRYRRRDGGWIRERLSP